MMLHNVSLSRPALYRADNQPEIITHKKDAPVGASFFLSLTVIDYYLASFALRYRSGAVDIAVDNSVPDTVRTGPAPAG